MLRKRQALPRRARYPDDRYCVRRSPSSASLTQYWDKFSIDALVWVFGVASANFRQSQATRLYSSAVLMGCVSPFAHEPRVSLGGNRSRAPAVPPRNKELYSS